VNFPNFLKSNGSNSGSESFRIGQEIPDSDNGSATALPNMRSSAHGKRRTFSGASRPGLAANKISSIFTNGTPEQMPNGHPFGGNIPQNMSFGGQFALNNLINQQHQPVQQVRHDLKLGNEDGENPESHESSSLDKDI